MPYFLRCSKVEMKNRSKFYLTPEDISDNETVGLRQKKSPSGDSGLGQSGKFWSIQEWSLFKCEYCIYPWISRASGWQTERADCNYLKK